MVPPCLVMNSLFSTGNDIAFERYTTTFVKLTQVHMCSSNC